MHMNLAMQSTDDAKRLKDQERRMCMHVCLQTILYQSPVLLQSNARGIKVIAASTHCVRA